MEALKLVAQAQALIKSYLADNDIENDEMLEKAYVLLEEAVAKMTDSMK